jgi:glutaredoxin
MSLQADLISRRGCHLCDEMKQFLERLQAERPFALRVVEVDSDPTLVLYYSHRVPVLVIGGKSVAELRWDQAAVRQLLLSRT